MVELNQSCTLNANGTFSCGTGGWVGPLPGDPSTSDIYITATPAFGGIDINITWPQINPEAVAYVSLYRSLLPDPESAALLDQFTGTFFHDRIEDPTKPTFYYWVRIMSVYGTYSEMIGPAWAQPKPRIEQMIEELTGQIDSGMLAQTLKQDIDQITLNKLGIDQELIDRAANDDALGVRITTVGAHSGETRALLQEEVLARTSQGEAFVSTVNTLYSELNGNIAAVQTTTTAALTEMGGRIDGLASQITQVETEVNGNIAQSMQQMRTEIAVVDGKVTNIGALWTAQVSVNGLIGGFGVYNDGRTVEAGFDVDRFWIGRTGATNRKPFIVEGSTVYIDDAAINKLTFSKLRDEAGTFIVQNGKIQAKYLEVEQLIANEAQSSNYVPGTSGWALKKDGTVEINGAGGQGRMIITQTLIRIFDAAGRLRIRMGLW
jgi:uncharacterized protein YoxC